MKAIHLLIATLIMMSLASCTAESSDPVDNSSSTYFLERTYGARSVTYEENNSDNLNLNDLPAISLKEADETFANIPMRKKNIMYWLPIKAIRLY